MGFRRVVGCALLTLVPLAAGGAAPQGNSAAQPACDRIAFEISRGHYARALAELSGASSVGRSEADQANLRGLALMLAGDTAKSIDAFDTALELKPGMPEARFNRAVAWLRGGEFARAARELAAIAADEHSPMRATASYHQALALDALGRTAEAENAVARAVQLDPALDDAILLGALFAEKRGDLQEAGKGYKTYLDRHPESLVAALRFGIAAQRAGFNDTARKYLERVSAAAPDSPEAVEARKFLVMWSE